MKLREYFFVLKESKNYDFIEQFVLFCVSLVILFRYIVFSMCCTRGGGVAKVHICSRVTSSGWKIGPFVRGSSKCTARRSYFQTKQTSACKHHKFMWSNWGEDLITWMKHEMWDFRISEEIYFSHSKYMIKFWNMKYEIYEYIYFKMTVFHSNNCKCGCLDETFTVAF